MYNTLLQSVTSLINIIGTVYAVLSILKLKPKDIYSKITLGGMDKADKDALIQREQARTGIGLIIIGWVLQFVFVFLNIDNLCCFISCVSVSVSIVLIWILLMQITNRKFKKKYVEFYQSQNETEKTHKDNHSWGEF